MTERVGRNYFLQSGTASRFLDDIEVKNVLPFEAALHSYMKTEQADLLNRIEENKRLDKDDESKLAEAIAEFKKGSNFSA